MLSNKEVSLSHQGTSSLKVTFKQRIIIVHFHWLVPVLLALCREQRPPHRLGKFSTTELDLQPKNSFAFLEGGSHVSLGWPTLHSNSPTTASWPMGLEV